MDNGPGKPRRVRSRNPPPGASRFPKDCQGFLLFTALQIGAKHLALACAPARNWTHAANDEEFKDDPDQPSGRPGFCP
jgi:hypothetical protein